MITVGYGDIKAENILIKKDFFKLADFGFCKQLA